MGGCEMDIWLVVLRTIFVYLLMVVVVHTLGKKETAKLPLLNMLIGFMIAHLAVRSLEHVQTPMLTNLLPISLLLVLQMGYVYFFSQSKTSKMKKEKETGQPESWPKEEQQADHPIHVPLILIKDGHLLTENMAKLGKTDFWLKAELKKRIGFTNFKHISFLSIDGFGHWYIDVKDYLPQK